MEKRIGLSPALHRALGKLLPDVTQGGSYDITIRLTTENGAWWAVYEGRSSIITVKTPAQALGILQQLFAKYKVVNQSSTRTLLRQLRTIPKEPECPKQPESLVSSTPRRYLFG